MQLLVGFNLNMNAVLWLPLQCFDILWIEKIKVSDLSLKIESKIDTKKEKEAWEKD